MAQLLPRAELHVFEESAHMTFVEEPQTYVEVVGSFLSRVG
jgi:proline iminopeptidase